MISDQICPSARREGAPPPGMLLPHSPGGVTCRHERPRPLPRTRTFILKILSLTREHSLEKRNIFSHVFFFVCSPQRSRTGHGQMYIIFIPSINVKHPGLCQVVPLAGLRRLGPRRASASSGMQEAPRGGVGGNQGCTISGPSSVKLS